LNIIVTLKRGSEVTEVKLGLMPFESLGAVSYSPFIVTMAVSVAVCEIFSVKEWRDDFENQVINDVENDAVRDHMRLSIGRPL